MGGAGENAAFHGCLAEIAVVVFEVAINP